MRTTMLKINDKYKSLFNNDKRYNIISGGRGSGKSYAVAMYLVMCTFDKEYGHILFTRWTLKSAHISIIPQFLSAIEVLGCSSSFYITKDEITNIKTGNKIYFRGILASSGSSQLANLKSIADVSVFVCEEAEELTNSAIFDSIDKSIRMLGKKNKVILVLNPTAKNHFIYKDFVEVKREDTNYIHTTYLDNKDNLDPSFIASAKRLKLINREKYNKIFLGGWFKEQNGLEIYNKFDENIHIKELKYNPTEPIYFSFDENSLPYSAVTVFQIKNNIIINQIDEICLLNTNIQDVCKYIHNKYNLHNNKIIIIGDATSQKRDVKLTQGENFFTIIYNTLNNLYKNKVKIELRVSKSNAKVSNRTEFFNAILSGEYEGLKYYVSDTCTETLQDFENVTWSNSGKLEKDKKLQLHPKLNTKCQLYAHCSDTIEYFLTTIFSDKYHEYLGMYNQFKVKTRDKQSY